MRRTALTPQGYKLLLPVSPFASASESWHIWRVRPRVGMCGIAALAAATGFGVGSARAAELLLGQPTACAIGDELAFRAERALGEPLADAADVRFTVHIARVRDGVSARLEMASPGVGGQPRQRIFQALDCEKLTETLALAVVLAVSSASPPDTADASSAASTPHRVQAADAAESEHSAPTEADLAGEDAAASRNGGGLVWGARAALVGDAGTVPRGGGALFGVLLGGEALEARVLGTYLPPRSVALGGSEAGTPGAELALAAGSLLGCGPRWVQTGRLELGACAGAELGWIWGNGTRVGVARHGGALWSAARAEAVARLGIGPRWLALDASLGALVPFERHDFALSEAGSVRSLYRPAAVAGRLSLGVSVEFE